MLKILKFVTADVSKCYQIVVTDRRDAERQIWSRFDRTDNALHDAFGFDWGSANSIVLVDSELTVWRAEYVDK